MTLWGLDSTAWAGGVEATSAFWGLDATAWAAVAAMGAFLAAVASMVAALFTHWGSGARPKVHVDLASLADDSLSRRGLKAKPNAEFWRSDGIEGVVVRIENAGRTPLTADKPVFECMDPWTKRRRWQRKKRRTIGTTALPFDGLVTDFPMRIEPHDMQECFLELAPLFGNPAAPGRHITRDWHHVRVRVKIAGRRDAVVRRRPIAAAPNKPQLSGEAVTLRQFLHRYFLRRALMKPEGDERDAALVERSMAVWSLLELHAAEGKFTRDTVQAVLTEDGGADLSRGVSPLSVVFALRDAGFMTAEDARPAPPADEPSA